MEALILNRKFEAQCVVDAFESFIWTNRYREPGDFEIYMPVDQAPMEYLKRDYYVWRKGTDRLMVIEDITIDTDAEKGPHITLAGRSLESLLERRVIAYRTIINGNLQNGIQRMLNENVISPGDSDRRMSEFRFIQNNDPRVTFLTMDVNLLGENLLEEIEVLCELHDLGFKVTYNEEQSTFDFMLFYGEDRSYNQESLPWVVFSPGYDNLLSSNYYESARNLRTAAVVAGDSNYERGQVVVDVDGKPELRGLDRREMFIEAGDIETPDPQVNEDAIRERLEKRGKKEWEIQEAIDQAMADALAQDTAAYKNQLQQRGREELSKTYITESFEGVIEAVRQYVFGRDFFIGDVVQVRDEFGKEAASRITEVVTSHDLTGETITPTFTTLIGGDNKTDE